MMESRMEGSAGVATASAIDESGKAIYGTPGPGSYRLPSSFGKVPVFDSAPTYKFGLQASNKVFISKFHEEQQAGKYSPGPKYAPTVQLVKPRAATFSFGTDEHRAFFSPRENTPGPGTYNPKTGKGIAKTMGDAPTFRFGTGPQREPPPQLVSTLHFPGPGTHSPTDKNRRSVPSMKFASSRASGRLRRKTDTTLMWVNEQYTKTTAPMLGRKFKSTAPSYYDSPGPGAYDAPTTFNYPPPDKEYDPARTLPNPPRFKFGTEPKARQEAKYEGYDLRPGRASPGPCYNPSSAPTQKKPGTVKFGTGPRFFKMPEGGSKAGPLLGMNQDFAKETLGSASPGPAAYHPLTGKGHANTFGDAPTFRFGTEVRQSLAKDGANSKWVPGPGTYFPKRDAELLGHADNKPGYSFAPSHSIGSNIRFQFGDPKDEFEPGPGAYDAGEAALHESQKQSAPSWKFGLRPEIPDPHLHEPGPGRYTPNKQLRAAPAFTFGSLPPSLLKPDGTPIHEGVPGPGTYDLDLKANGDWNSGSVAPRSQTFKFGTGKRGNSKIYNPVNTVGSMGDTPGPGAYTATRIDVTSKYQSKGGVKFGTSQRPPLHTVVF